jgi:hypothetical protein
VLVDDGRVLNGHLPAREWHEARAESGVALVQRRAPERLHRADPIRNRAGLVIVERTEMSASEERVAEIESLFRNVNERIATAADDYEVESAEFFCECHDPACGERVVVPLDEYERVRADGSRFVHAIEHVEPEFERVVERSKRYAIVEKVGRRLRALVHRLDPRRGRAPSSGEELA